MDYFEHNAGQRRAWQPSLEDTIEADVDLEAAFIGREGIVVESEERFDSTSGLYRRLVEVLEEGGNDHKQ